MANEWIENTSGVCPVAEGTLIDVQYRDGEEKSSIPALVWQRGRDSMPVFWELEDSGADIVAWRFSEEFFDIGDTVVCIDASESKLLKVGGEYLVKALQGKFLWLDFFEVAYYKGRFKLYTKATKLLEDAYNTPKHSHKDVEAPLPPKPTQEEIEMDEYKVDISVDKILAAFYEMTGVSMSSDQWETLQILNNTFLHF